MDYEKLLAECDGQIVELQTKVAEAAKSVETADKLVVQIEELKA